MRYATPLLASLCLLLTGCVTTASQMEPAGPAPEPMDAANRVLIRTQDAPKDAYQKTARILQREGYTLSNTDETLLTLTTDWKNYQGTSGEMRVTAIVDERDEGATVTLRGKNVLRISGGEFAESAGSEIQNTGQPESPMQNSFKELERLASQYESAEIAYARN